jgi:D-tyrosyl-tRNA(Tyr) deacylase
VDNSIVGQIGRGLLLFVGIGEGDTEEQALQLAKKISLLRIFDDATRKMNLSLLDVGGEALIVSQFTLYGDTSKGNRPSYSHAARPEHAKYLYEIFVAAFRKTGILVSTGRFQAHMDVSLVNEGPVTLMCTSDA